MPIDWEMEIGLVNVVSEPNSLSSLMYSGSEDLVGTVDCVEKYDGQFGSRRYLLKEGTKIIAGLKVVHKEGRAVASMVYVEDGYRRRGIASYLFSLAEKDFSGLEFDACRTEDGNRLLEGRQKKLSQKSV